MNHIDTRSIETFARLIIKSRERERLKREKLWDTLDRHNLEPHVSFRKNSIPFESITTGHSFRNGTKIFPPWKRSRRDHCPIPRCSILTLGNGVVRVISIQALSPVRLDVHDVDCYRVIYLVHASNYCKTMLHWKSIGI